MSTQRLPKLEWREDPGAAKMILDAIRGEMGGPREMSDEPHLTELIYCLTKSWFGRYGDVFAGKDINVLPTDEEVEIWSLGIGLEKVILAPHKRHERGVFEGIRYELDVLFGFAGLDGELKTTRISSKNLPYKMDSKTKQVEYNMPEGWEKQMLGYWWIKNQLTGDDKEMLFIPWHLMGSYSPPFPQVKAWRVRPVAGAAEENWAWLQERKEIYQAHLDEGSPPEPFKYNMPYECDGCRLKLICDSLDYARKQGAV